MAKLKNKKIKKGVSRAKVIKRKVVKKKKVLRKIKTKKNAKSRKVLRKKTVVKLKKRIIKKKSVKKIIRKKIKPKKKIIKLAIKNPTHNKKPIVRRDNSDFEAESLFKARIKVIGVGGGGGSIVSEIGKSLHKATFVVADTDIRALKKRSGIKYLWFGENLTHGLGTGVNIDIAKQAAQEAKEKISGIFKDQDIIIFIASLGGGLGSGATQIFAEAAREFGGITLGIFTLPFKFEGKNKLRIAQSSLRSLRKVLNVSIAIPNEKIFKIIDDNTPITEAFSVVNKSLIGSLESLIDLIYNPGIINIDFADLRTILKGVGNIAFLNTAEEFGKNRAEKICEKILINPLLQSNSFESEKILFNVAGSENLSMFEVEKISRHIADLNPKAKIIFGISKNPKLKNKIKTTILMTGGEVKPVIEKKNQQVKKVYEEKKQPILVEEKKEVKVETRVLKKEKKTVAKVKKPTKKPVRKRETKVARKVGVSIPVAPVLEPVAPALAVLEQKKINVTEIKDGKNLPAGRHGTIRRSALEIKKAEEQEEKKKIDQEKEWEIPAFLRRVKFNK